MNKKLTSLIAALTVALSLVAGGLIGLGNTKPAEAAWVSSTLVQIHAGATGYSSYVTSTARWIGNNDIVGYMGSIDFTTPSATEFQTVTTKLQYSPNNSVWYDHTTLHNAVSDDATLTPDNIEAVGLWVRVIYTPSVITTTAGTNINFTPTLYLVLR